MDIKLSDTEQALYDFVKKGNGVTFEEVKKELGDKYLGATGKLVRYNLVEVVKRLLNKEVKYGYPRFIKAIQIKKEEKSNG